jgi:uncharacterized protein YjbI with pentapeptide repeats
MEEVIVALVALSAVLGTLIGHILARSQGKNNYQDNNHLRAIYGNQPRKPDVTAIIDRSTKTWGIFWWRRWNRPDLISAQLAKSYLRGVDFKRALLSNADLSDAMLSECNFSGCELADSNMASANLIAADLREANMSNVNLSDSYLSRANLRV